MMMLQLDILVLSNLKYKLGEKYKFNLLTNPLSFLLHDMLRKRLQFIFKHFVNLTKHNCCKLQILFKSQNKLSNAFRSKSCIPKEHTLVSPINVSVDSTFTINPVMMNV